MYPTENLHYQRGCKVVGNIDINEDRFITEYKNNFLSKWLEFKDKN